MLSGKEIWKTYREIADKIWAKALKNKVRELTGSDIFTFYLIVTQFRGNRVAWEECRLFRNNLDGCDIKLMSMQEMLTPLQRKLTITPAHSELSRMLQLIKAGGGSVTYDN
jgi:hypothetical protein